MTTKTSINTSLKTSIDVAYGLTRVLRKTSLASARERITASLKNEGFGILTEIDVRATFKNKLGIDFRPYVILGACNPQLAHKALTAEPGVGLILPCNVVVAETPEGDSEISIAKPESMFQIVGNDGLRDFWQSLVNEATQKLTRALDNA